MFALNSYFSPEHSEMPGGMVGSQGRGERSEVKQKVSVFKTEIRNRQIGEFKSKIREELIRVGSIERMLQSLPQEYQDTFYWVEDLLRLYGSVESFKFTPTQAVEIFKLVERFPNKLTFELFQLVVLRADIAALDQIFQFDVMKLLHSSLNLCEKEYGHFERSYSSEETERIIHEAVVYRQNGTFRKEGLTLCQDTVELVRIILRIIGDLCRKSAHIRNFAVINHKTYTYCLKVYKHFGDEVKGEFYSALQSFSFFPFKRSQEQFDRISGKIMTEFFNQGWQFFGLQYNEDGHIKELISLMEGMRHLLESKCGWMVKKLRMVEEKFNVSLFDKYKRIVKEFTLILLSSKEKITAIMCKFLKSVVMVVMSYEEVMDVESGQCEYWKRERVSIYFDLVAIIQEGQGIASLQQVRSGLYFILSNCFLDAEVSNSTKYALLVPSTGSSFLSVLSNLLFYQTQFSTTYELCYLIHSLFAGVPLTILEPLLIPSQILQAMCCKVVSDYRNAELISSVIILVKGLIMFLTKAEDELKVSSPVFKRLIGDQFSGLFCKLLEDASCDNDLGGSIEHLLELVSMR